MGREEHEQSPWGRGGRDGKLGLLRDGQSRYYLENKRFVVPGEAGEVGKDQAMS